MLITSSNSVTCIPHCPAELQAAEDCRCVGVNQTRWYSSIWRSMSNCRKSFCGCWFVFISIQKLKIFSKRRGSLRNCGGCGNLQRDLVQIKIVVGVGLKWRIAGPFQLQVPLFRVWQDAPMAQVLPCFCLVPSDAHAKISKSEHLNARAPRLHFKTMVSRSHHVCNSRAGDSSRWTSGGLCWMNGAESAGFFSFNLRNPDGYPCHKFVGEFASGGSSVLYRKPSNPPPSAKSAFLVDWYGVQVCRFGIPDLSLIWRSVLLNCHNCVSLHLIRGCPNLPQRRIWKTFVPSLR